MKKSTQQWMTGALLLGLGVLAVGSLLWAVTEHGARAELVAEIAKHTRTVQEQREAIAQHEEAGRTLESITKREAVLAARVAAVNTSVDEINAEYTNLDDESVSMVAETEALRERMATFEARDRS